MLGQTGGGTWRRLPSALSALAFREYRLIWTGQVISNVGSSMQQLGLGWLIVQLAERDRAGHLVPVYLGLVGLSRGVPVVFAGLAAGVIADRVDRRKLLIGVQIYWAVVCGALAWLTLSGLITIGMVLPLSLARERGLGGEDRQKTFSTGAARSHRTPAAAARG